MGESIYISSTTSDKGEEEWESFGARVSHALWTLLEEECEVREKLANEGGRNGS